MFCSFVSHIYEIHLAKKTKIPETRGIIIIPPIDDDDAVGVDEDYEATVEKLKGIQTGARMVAPLLVSKPRYLLLLITVIIIIIVIVICLVIIVIIIMIIMVTQQIPTSHIPTSHQVGKCHRDEG